MHIDVAPEVGVEVRPVAVVEVAGVGPAVRHPGPLYQQLRHGGGPAGHHDGADSASGPGELDTLRREGESFSDKLDWYAAMHIKTLYDNVLYIAFHKA